MSKVGGRGPRDTYSHHINRLMRHVAVSWGACDRDTATRLKSGAIDTGFTLHFGGNSEQPAPRFLLF